MDLKERFLKYVSYDTQSSEESTTFPSTEKQKVLLAALRDEGIPENYLLCHHREAHAA